MTPFIMFSEEYGPVHKDVQIVTRSRRVDQPAPVDRSFAGTTTREDVRREDVKREDDKILHQMHTTQARISI